ncbi:hypothetical protein [Pseudomonas mucidolens]|uniref:Uncharacterized protein n=1 Tax=Pseudomonas mucidolens TaxID=46679 RepID=A0A1H2LYU2_9PSED|nr:hypothetical protein [Pseudomonas mucidolens]SDU85456.1 hypothetical protein SAMN05216202_0618 [Pseudomonas mucidolens]SQH35085.1 Uncharacterised protein [Pseudomonas mucidolens]
MPQIRRFTGVNSVTNIEPDTGFMPVLLFKFADWLEKFSRGTQSMLEPHVPNQKVGWHAHRIAMPTFAFHFKTSGKLPICSGG